MGCNLSWLLTDQWLRTDLVNFHMSPPGAPQAVSTTRLASCVDLATMAAITLYFFQNGVHPPGQIADRRRHGWHRLVDTLGSGSCARSPDYPSVMRGTGREEEEGERRGEERERES